MPESARAPACLPEGFCTRSGGEGPVLGCTGAPGPFLSADPMRALQLIRLAAESGCAADWDCFSAAMEAAPALVHADPLAVRDELNRALTGPCPQALAPLVQAGGLLGVGIRGCACLHPLAQAPSGLLSRWWLFLRLCGADAEQAARRMKLGQSFCQDYAHLDELFRAGPPADRLALKRRLAEGAPLPEEYDLAALAKKDVEAGVKLPPLYIACGTEDFLYKANAAFVDELKGLGADITWDAVEGYTHEWRFWDLEVERFLDWIPRDDIYAKMGKRSV